MSRSCSTPSPRYSASRWPDRFCPSPSWCTAARWRCGCRCDSRSASTAGWAAAFPSPAASSKSCFPWCSASGPRPPRASSASACCGRCWPRSRSCCPRRPSSRCAATSPTIRAVRPGSSSPNGSPRTSTATRSIARPWCWAGTRGTTITGRRCCGARSWRGRAPIIPPGWRARCSSASTPDSSNATPCPLGCASSGSPPYPPSMCRSSALWPATCRCTCSPCRPRTSTGPSCDRGARPCAPASTPRPPTSPWPTTATPCWPRSAGWAVTSSWCSSASSTTRRPSLRFIAILR